MPQFAPVCPPQLLKGLKMYGESVVGRYHLLLAHDVAARSAEYTNLLPARSMVIMDNSVIELGHPVTADVMARALKVVQAQLVVLPDIIRDYERTLILSNSAAKTYADVMEPHQKFMAVPQGRDLYELQDCAQHLARIPGVAVWGVGRHIVDMLGSRKEIVEYLRTSPMTRLNPAPFGNWIHLLGFSENLADDLECARMPGVMGIDSAVPLRMGQADQLITAEQQSHDPRKKWWDEETGTVRPTTLGNLSLIREWLRSTEAPPEWLKDPSLHEAEFKGSLP